MNQDNILETLYVPYNKTKIIDSIYINCQILKREDNEMSIKFKVSGEEKKINNIIDQIKKWAWIIR